MSQVAFKTPASEKVAPLTPAEKAFAESVAALVSAASSAAFNRGEATEANKALNVAERVAAWAAFDLAGNDKDKAETLAVQVATAKGVKEENFRVYRQRARDAATTYHAKVADADRAKANPWTLAKKLRETEAKHAAVATENKPHMDEAMSLAAGALQTTVGDLVGRMVAGDEAASEAMSAALAEVKGRATLLDDVRALLARIAVSDDETKAKVGALIGLA